ncbi:MAG: hypothetical protein IPL13_08105 [Saprospiraceae bacterium]|nr:hypothetical protein [Candidatus Brachybacter algidus]
MKKLIGVIVMSLVLSMSWTACSNESKQHAEDAKTNMNEAGQDMKESANAAASEAKAKAEADWIAFKSETEQKLNEIEADINEREAKNF